MEKQERSYDTELFEHHFVQLCGVEHNLYALDKIGFVWLYVPGRDAHWRRISHVRTKK